MTEEEHFKVWLAKPEVLELAAEVGYEHGDIVYYTEGSQLEDTALHKLLWMAYNWGLVTRMVDELGEHQ